MGFDRKTQISSALKKLRHKRHLSQAEMAKILDVSQPSFSLIETGKISLSAEKFLILIERFNLSLGDFINVKKKSPEHELQNALVRLGAKHLREISGVIISEDLQDCNEVIWRILSAPSHSRLVVFLAPVILKNISDVHFLAIYDRLTPIRKQNRLWWLVEQIYEAVTMRLNKDYLSRDLAQTYKKSQKILLKYKRAGEALQDLRGQRSSYDILDCEVISSDHVSRIREKSDDCAQRWRLLTGLTRSDFYNALVETDQYES